MREIKFRYWSPPIKIMLDWEDVKDDMYAGELCTFTEANIPMQFTGLLDKNGKETYEGDIVKWTTKFNDNKIEHIDRIEWQEKYACYMLVPWIHELYGANMEVIGNVYENPELLKEK